MPYIQRDKANAIIGAFMMPQEGFAEEFISDEDYEEYKRENHQPISYNPPVHPNQRLLAMLADSTIWATCYQAAKVSTAAQAAFTMILSGLAGNWAEHQLAYLFRDFLDTLNGDSQLEPLSSEQTEQLKAILSACGFSPDSFVPELAA